MDDGSVQRHVIGAHRNASKEPGVKHSFLGADELQVRHHFSLLSKALDPLCSQKVWRKITLVDFQGNLRKFKGNLRKNKGDLRKLKGNLRGISGNKRGLGLLTTNFSETDRVTPPT